MPKRVKVPYLKAEGNMSVLSLFLKKPFVQLAVLNPHDDGASGDEKLTGMSEIKILNKNN